MLFWWLTASQVSLSSLSLAVRAGIGIGRFTAGPLLRFAARRLWNRQRESRSLQNSPHLFLVTQDCEYMLVTIARKKWKKQLAFIDKDSSITVRTCELSRSPEGVLSWKEYASESTVKKPVERLPDTLIVPINSGLVFLNGRNAHLYSLTKRGKEISVSKKQTPSISFNASSCAAHLGHDSLTAIGYNSQSLALFRNRHNTWSLINTSLPPVTINSCLVTFKDRLIHLGGRNLESAELSEQVWALKMPPENLPLGVRLQEFQMANWETCAPLPVPCEKMGVANFLWGLAVIGGSNQTGKALATVQLFNPIENEWIMGPPLRKARFSPSVVRIGNYILVFQGYDSEGKPERQVEAIHVRNLVEFMKENMPHDAELSDDDLELNGDNDNPWITVCHRSDLLECKVVVVNDEVRFSPAFHGSGDLRKQALKSIRLTSDSDEVDDIPALDDPLSWFFA